MHMHSLKWVDCVVHTFTLSMWHRQHLHCP